MSDVQPKLTNGRTGYSRDSTEGQSQADTTKEPTGQYQNNSGRRNELLPRIFGDYELLECIASGGMGTVYKARQLSLDRIVALKMILSGEQATDEQVKRFHAEARSAAGVSHPGIVPVFDVGFIDGQHFFAMGFIEGPSLASRISTGPLSPQQAAVMVKQIALAMQAAHQQGLIHRDLKPGNIMLEKGEEPRITDFGLAKQIEGRQDLTMSGVVMGTPSFMSPEQANGVSREVTASTDVYAIGGILYACLTGQPPFQAGTQLDTLMMVLQNEPVPPRQLNKHVPRDLELICLKCLEKNPVHRYAMASDLAADLDCFLAGEPISVQKDWLRRLRKWTVREPVLASHFLATILIMAFILVNYLVFGHFGPNPKESFWVLQVNWVILLIWATAVFFLQKLKNASPTLSAISLIWATINPIFLTILIGVNDGPRSILCASYVVLMISACFFRRIEYLVVTSVFSLIGYLVLMVVFFRQETSFPLSTTGIPRSYLVILGATILISAVLLYFLALRIQRLSQKSSGESTS
ncbi:MAG: protein kinase [Pirellulaceae bacterium]